jgi:prepilin signal peptidase PulO-like enzyme (type II secretory pathway)
MVIIFFILGLIVGSFLNCTALRLIEKEQFISGKSKCPKCSHKLGILDLIPVFSFIFLKGKCRYCKSKISTQYMLTEIATGILFSLIYLYLNNIIFWLFIISVFIIIFIIDLKTFIIPDKILIPTILISMFYVILFQGDIINRLIGAGVWFLFFLGINVISKGKWMGFGDVKLAILLGFLISWPNILMAMFLSFFLGAIIGVGLILIKKKGMKTEVPFAPFLITGTVITLFLGDILINWYLSLIL